MIQSNKISICYPNVYHHTDTGWAFFSTLFFKGKEIQETRFKDGKNVVEVEESIPQPVLVGVAIGCELEEYF